MLHTLRLVSILALLTLLMTQFTNCGGVEPSQMDDLGSTSALNCDDDCITPSTDYLQIKAHLGGSGTEYGVRADLRDFNIGGDCNEGGYPHNIIRWELHLNGIKVRDSGMLGMAGSQPVNSRCVNGRYLLYVNLAQIPADNVNRTGLRTSSGTRGPYDLFIEIQGQDTVNDQIPKRNLIKGRIRVALLPL